MNPGDHIVQHMPPRQSHHYDPVRGNSEVWTSPAGPVPSYNIFPDQFVNPAAAAAAAAAYAQLPPIMPSGDPFYERAAGAMGGRLPSSGPTYHHVPEWEHPAHMQSRYFGFPVPVPLANPQLAHGNVASANGGNFAPQVPGARLAAYQPPLIPTPSAGVALASGPSQPAHARMPFALSNDNSNSNSGNNTNGLPQSNGAHSPPTHVQSLLYMSPTRREHLQSSAGSNVPSRATRGDTSPQTRSPPSAYPRRNPRTRRPSRTMPNIDRDTDDERTRQYILAHSMPGSRRLDDETDGEDSLQDERTIRQMQLYRGSLRTKMVASKAALQSIKTVKIEDLPEADRTCNICYNDFGVQSPEGINENPVRLPKCKHIFGDSCLQKWLDDNDTCPYCRDKLHAEPKSSGNASSQAASSQAFMSYMRARGMPFIQARNIEVFERLNREARAGGWARVPATGRRPPPDEDEQARRIRPRRNS